MSTDINWRLNCLTTTVHDGRPETIWNLPLHQAFMMFGTDGLRQLVVARIYNDAMQFVERGDTNQEWAAKVAALAEENFDELLTKKLSEITNYYSTSRWLRDVEDVIEVVKKNDLNPHYQPLHGHDSVNLLCRILGQSCMYKAEKALKS